MAEKECTLKVCQYTVHCVSRPRGREIANHILGLEECESVVIDFSGVKMVTASFLDEMIRDLSEKFEGRNIAFTPDRPELRERIKRVLKQRNYHAVQIVTDEGRKVLA